MRIPSISRPLALIGAAVVALVLGAAGGRAQESPTQSVDEGGMAGRARCSCPCLDSAALHRAPSATVARGACAGSGRPRDGEGDARLVGVRRRAAGAVPRAPVRRRRAHRARVPLHARDQRILGSSRPDVGGAARPRPRGRRRLPGAHRVPSAGGRVRRRRAPVGRRRPRDRRPRRLGRDGRAPRHRRRPVASVPAAARPLGRRRASTRAAAGSPSRIRRSPAARSGMRQSSPGSSPAPRVRTVCTGSRRARRSCPVRVGGWQPNSEGGYSVYSRTDQILAGLEAAVDPNDDGDVLDAARIALIGMVEPYAAFADGPLPRAIAGAADLDMLTIVPAGNDGRAGPGYGSIAGPGRRGRRRDRRRRRRTPRSADRPRATFEPGCGSCTRTTSRSAEPRRTR